MAGLAMEQAIYPRSPAAARSSLLSLAPYVLWPLLAAGLSELILFRTLSRVGVHIPKEGAVLEVFGALVRVGSFAFNVSSVAVVIAVALLAYTASRGELGQRPIIMALAPAIGAFVCLSVSFAFVAESGAAKLLYALISAAIMLGLAAEAWSARRMAPLRTLVIIVTVLAYVTAQYHVIASQAYETLRLHTEPPGAMLTLQIAEGLVLLNAFLIFWCWSGVRTGRSNAPTRLQWSAGALLIVLFLGSYYGRPDSSTASILSLWSLGLTLYLPVPLYAIALGLYGVTLVRLVTRARRDERFLWDAAALGLLPVAGLTLELTYQHLTALLVLLLLTSANRSPGRSLYQVPELSWGKQNTVRATTQPPAS